MLIIFRDKIEEKIFLDRDEIQHIKALRLNKKDTLLVSNGKGIAYYATVEEKNYVQVNFELEPIVKNFQNISIASAIPSGNRLDKMIDIAVQLGISSYYPIIFDFSERKEFSLDRLKKIAKQASSQSKNLILPEIYKPKKFNDFINYVYENKIIFYADIESENSIKLNELFNYLRKYSLEEFIVIVGPEGGYSKKEREYLKEHFLSFYLSPNILRIETAVVTLLSIFSFLSINVKKEQPL